MFVQRRTRTSIIATATALLALAAAATPASAAGKRSVVFKPAKSSTSVVTFKLRGVKPRRVVRAAIVRKGRVRQRIDRRLARRAARRGVLRVPVRTSRAQRRTARSVRAGRRKTRLWVRRVARKSVKLKVVNDTRPPDTRITSGPSGSTTSTTADFAFKASEKRSTFECRLDGGGWRSCKSPVSYTGLAGGEHSFGVRARDRAGNVDPTPAERSWTVVTQADAPAATEPSAEQPAPAPSDPNVLFLDTFTGPDGVITNHYAFWKNDPSAHYSDSWEMESGCALRQDNTLWTGVPTSGSPNKDCSNGSGSEVFRLWTKRDFRDVNVTFSLRNNGYVAGSGGERSWDGVKIWLRRQGGTGSVGLYTAEVNRRQGNIMIQKKCAGSSTYHILSQARPSGSDASIGQWEKVGGVVRNEGGSVKLALVRHGRVVLEATDSGVGCAPITTAGRVGIRGDNTNFNADDFLVAPAA